MTTPGWGRYHLLPQVGLTLLICGGLPHRLNGSYQQVLTQTLSPRRMWVITILIATLFVIQLPRAIIPFDEYDPAQAKVLGLIEEIDASCREHHIDARLAREALESLRLPSCGETDNGWELLRGSPDPQPMTLEDARRLLGDGSNQ